MNDALNEQISAFVDGELSEPETELLLRRLAQDRSLRDAVGRYMEIGRQLRREPEVPGVASLRGRIEQALDGHDTGRIESDRPGVTRYFKPVAGFAVAASVTIVALIGFQQGGDSPIGPANTTQAVAESSDIAYTVPSIADFEQTDPSSALARFYLKHGATTSAMGSNDVNSRLVSFELLETGIEEPDAATESSDDEVADELVEE